MDREKEDESFTGSEKESVEEASEESDHEMALGTGETTKILVTGGNGYLGSHIVEKLLSKGVSVRASVSDLSNESRYAHLKTFQGAERLEIVEGKLTDRHCWKRVVDGCAAIIHTASPTPYTAPKQELDVIYPAVEGTVAILQAAEELGVRRVVITSCFTTIKGGKYKYSYNEDSWAEPENVTNVEKSKIFAERAAWHFQKEKNDKIDLTVICPGFLLGPTLQNHSDFSSGLFFKKWTTGEITSVLKMQFPLCDVRDAATVHMQALWNPNAINQRYLCVEKMIGLEEFNSTLSRKFSAEGFVYPDKVISSLTLKIIAFFDPIVRTMVPFYGKDMEFSREKLNKDFNFPFRGHEETIIDMGMNFIEKGFYKNGPRIKPSEAVLQERAEDQPINVQSKLSDEEE